MSATELLRWKAYFSIIPFDDYREDFRMGVIASTLVNVNRSSKSQKIVKPDDFIPKFTLQEIKKSNSNSSSRDEFLQKAKLFQMMMS